PPEPALRSCPFYPTTSDACSCPDRTTATASPVAPGCQAVTCTVAGKMNSATRLSPLVGQPKSTTVSPTIVVPGSAVSRPLATDATSSCADASLPSSTTAA